MATKGSQKSNAGGSQASQAASAPGSTVASTAESVADASKASKKVDKDEMTKSYAGSTMSSAASGASKSASAMTSSAASQSNTGTDMDSSMADATITMASEMSTMSNMQEKEQPPAPPAEVGCTGRKLILMRHAERMDRIFNVWLRIAFTDDGKYRPYDLNQPLILPKRSDGVQAYHNDTPITEMGNVASQMLGRGMRLNKMRITHLVVSPALRCIQTAASILKAYNVDSLKICVEPGLFEWLGWYESTPTWIAPDELEAHNFKVDTKYKPVMTEEELCQCSKENEKQYYERSEKVIKRLMQNFKDASTVLIVAHGVSLDACARPLLGRKMLVPSKAQFDKMGLYFPYNSVIGLEELSSGVWRMPKNNPLPGITYLDFSNKADPDFFGR